MNPALRLLAVAALLFASGAPALAAEGDAAQGAAGQAPAAVEPSEAKRVLTPEEKAEKEARKACKTKICDIIATRDPNGEDVTCDIVKTWREEDIVKMLGGRSAGPAAGLCASRSSSFSASRSLWR